MSPPDFSDPESKLRLSLVRPPRAVAGFSRFYFTAMKLFLGFCAIALIPISYFEFRDRGFSWGLAGDAVLMLGGIAMLFVLVDLLSRISKWMARRP
jgi:hypothetical protein